MVLRALLIVVAAIPASCWAQESLNTAVLSAVFSDADLVVVGTLRQDFKFPWVDGSNERGHVEIERILKGSHAPVAVSFAWERDFMAGWCLTRPDWRGEVGRRGIWFLVQDGRRYRANMFYGFLDITYLNEVTRVLPELTALPAGR